MSLEESPKEAKPSPSLDLSDNDTECECEIAASVSVAVKPVCECFTFPIFTTHRAVCSGTLCTLDYQQSGSAELPTLMIAILI